MFTQVANHNAARLYVSGILLTFSLIKICASFFSRLNIFWRGALWVLVIRDYEVLLPWQQYVQWRQLRWHCNIGLTRKNKYWWIMSLSTSWNLKITPAKCFTFFFLFLLMFLLLFSVFFFFLFFSFLFPCLCNCTLIFELRVRQRGCALKTRFSNCFKLVRRLIKYTYLKCRARETQSVYDTKQKITACLTTLYIKSVSRTDSQPPVGKGFKCSLILSAQRLIGTVLAWWFSAFVTSDFLRTKLVSFKLFGVR